MITNAINWILKSQGRVLLKPRYHWGVDPYADIRRFAEVFKIPIRRFFDVGAHEGETATKALEEFPGVDVVSFEPHPDTFSKLRMKMGNAAGFVGVNFAVGNEPGDFTMTEYDNTKLNSLTERAPFAVRYGNKGKSRTVRCTTIDAYCEENQIGYVDVLKIDTEGFDMMVLEGARKLLGNRAIKFIYLEFNDLQPSAETFGGALLPIDSLLRPYGFRFATSYLDSAVTDGELFFSSNALFVLQP